MVARNFCRRVSRGCAPTAFTIRELPRICGRERLAGEYLASTQWHTDPWKVSEPNALLLRVHSALPGACHRRGLVRRPIIRAGFVGAYHKRGQLGDLVSSESIESHDRHALVRIRLARSGSMPQEVDSFFIGALADPDSVSSPRCP
jgi:hypothetical protein